MADEEETKGENTLENSRELAVSMLLEIMEKERYSHMVIREVLNKYDYMDSRDKAFMKRLTEGTLERRIQLDAILNQFSKVPVSKMKPFIRTLLRMSVYQLLFMDGVPDGAVCNEAVKLAGKRGFRNLQGFVNGVLRTIAREKENICYPDKDKEFEAYLSMVYSVPDWLVQRFLFTYGKEKTEKMLSAFLTAAPVTVRITESLSEADKAKLIKSWEEGGIFVKQHPYLSYAYQLSGIDGMQNLAGFTEGLCTVQDVSSMLVCEAADIQKNYHVIDVCAAPGGKSAHAAEKLQKTGYVSARDLTAYKAGLIRNTIDRMQLSNIEEMVADACVYRAEDKESADIVFADLPCSGLGIIGKKKDIKYHVSEERLRELAALQRKILSVVWQYVKPGGVLLYSTCTVNPMENEENVDWFTQNYPFQTESLIPYLPNTLWEDERSGMLQLLPGIHETDGFFIARLRRQND